MQEARRMQQLPPYLFARIEEKIASAKAAGRDVISLGIGDPDRPTPGHIITRIREAVQDPANHRYPTSAGLLDFRRAVAGWYGRRYGVNLDPVTQVVTLIGSKEGIGHIPFCYLDPGDIALVPDPGYPVYGIATMLAGGEAYTMPLKEKKGYLPDLEDIPGDVARKAKLMFLNYPNNPTGALATADFYRDVVAFAREYDILVCHDAAYSEVAFDGLRPAVFLATPGALDVGIEFNSLSKPYNMTGWRIAWAAGNPAPVEVLGRLKSNLDSGAFQAVQYAAMAALDGPQDSVAEMCRVYQERRDVVIEALNDMGWDLRAPGATFYVWAPVPRGYTSSTFAEEVLDKADVIITPGNGYGEFGEGYFRIALTVEVDRLQEAMSRLKRVFLQVDF